MTQLATKPDAAEEPTSPKEYSFEEVHELNHNSGRYELVDGRLVEKKTASFKHGKYILRLGGKLTEFAEANDLGEVSTDAGYILRREPRILRAPDIPFVSKARIPESGVPEEGYWEIAPDLAVEIVSPNDIMNEVLSLAVEYIEAGVKEVWIVAPAGRLVLIYQSLEKIRLLSIQDDLENNELLAGFKMGLSQLLS